MDCSALAKSYNTLNYASQLREMLSAFYNSDSFKDFSKKDLIREINDILIKNYQGEQILKYKLSNEFRDKKYIAAFEVKAKNSRTDFLVINGDTKSFEVKSKIDNLNRLQKQTNDYGDVFEYNTVVIDKIHLNAVLEMIPEYYGIWYFEGYRKVIYRKANYSPKLSAISQLELFNKAELRCFFNETDIVKITSAHTADQINTMLKSALKSRYEKRWTFLKDNWSEIFPVDVQFFFNNNIKPEIVYGC